jgi:methionyl-tRNA formyltransferase
MTRRQVEATVEKRQVTRLQLAPGARTSHFVDVPKLRIVFMGTPDLACVSLRALAACPDFEVAAVVTQPDRPKGRDLRLLPPPSKVLALELGLPVLQPEKARHESFVAELRRYAPDLIVVAAFGQILPASILDLPPQGCLNVHTSLLPRYRGAAPIQWAILNDDPETGVTIMKVDVGLDTGAIIATQATPISEADTSQTLHDRLAEMGAALLVRTIPGFVSGAIKPTPQSAEGVVYAHKIKKQDGLINWTQPARQIWNRIRGLMPWPGAFTHLPSGGKSSTSSQPHLLKIWQAEITSQSGPPGEVLSADKTGIVVGCGTGSLRILQLQREGGKRLAPGEFLTGHALRPGHRFGT